MIDQAVVGRDAELSKLEAILDAVASGTVVLTLAGGAGIGKSTLWSEGVARAERRGMRVLVARPAEVEASLAYAGLADLLGTVAVETRSQLPEPRRRALSAALLEEPLPRGGIDQRAVASAVLSLAQLLAAERPLLIAIDDLQWLDTPSLRSLEFAGRRLAEEPIGFLLTQRDGLPGACRFDGAFAAERRHMIELAGVSVAALNGMFKLHLGHSFPRPLLVQIEHASAGNPFYALELARALESGPVDGGRLRVPARLGALVEARIDGLPASTRSALLVASALSQPRVDLVDRAALAPAEAAGIAAIEDGRVRFVHPLYASAVYWQAADGERRDLHRRLSGIVSDLEQRARHLALASTGPDPVVASVLDEAAGRAAARGAPTAAAEIAELALRLTADGDEELPGRRIALGRHLFEAGATRGAIKAFEQAVDEAPPGLLRGEALFRMGWLKLLEGERALGARLAESALEWASEPALAGRIHALLADVRRTDLASAIEHGRRAVELLDPGEQPGPYASALQFLAEAKLLAGLGADDELVERSLELERQTNPWELNHLGGAWASGMDDFAAARARYHELIAGYEDGRISDGFLPSGLARLATVEVWTGRWERAEQLAREALELAEQTEQPVSACLARYPLGLVLAHRGGVDEARELVLATLGFLGERPEPILRVQAAAVLGFLELSLGNVPAAADAFSEADARLESLGWTELFNFRYYGDQVEAAIALDRLDDADRLVERIEASAARVPRPWIAGIAARGRGLLLAAQGDPDGALRFAERAVVHHGRIDMPFECARSLLVVGVIQRRCKRKRLARETLLRARAGFAELGAPLWVARAEAELRRVTVRSAHGHLSPTEAQIAGLAASGLTNRAIATRTYVSVKTVEANLARTYRKLGIASRAQLAAALEQHSAQSNL